MEKSLAIAALELLKIDVPSSIANEENEKDFSTLFFDVVTKTSPFVGKGKDAIPDSVSELVQWIFWAKSDVSVDGLRVLDEILNTKSYLVGNCFSAADAIVFLKVRGADIHSFVNISRWFEHIDFLTIRSGVSMAKAPTVFFKAAPVNSKDKVEVPKEVGKKEEKKDEKKESKNSDKKVESKEAKKEAPEAPKKEKKAKEGAKDTAAAPAAPAAPAGNDSGATGGDEDLDPSKLDIRVGLVVKCWNHPESEKLICEEIDLGEEKPRMIASGLRAFYSAEQVQGQKVLVLANLKERPLAGFKSQVGGIYMCIGVVIQLYRYEFGHDCSCSCSCRCEYQDM